MTLEQAFQKQALANAQTAMLAHGCPTRRLIQTLESRGGVETARELARRRRVSDGFEDLRRCGHLELTPEALMTQSRFGALFTDDEVNWCLDMLVEAGYY